MVDRKSLPSEKTFLLWVKAGGRCEFMGCNKILFKDSFIPSFEYNLADKAHIVANSPDGPRGSKKLSKKLAIDISNLMLLCKECHKRIDANHGYFTVEKLSEMKKQHEKRIERVTSITDDCRTNVIIYSANIGFQNNPVDINGAQIAVIMNNMYPIEPIIDLSLSGHASTDNEVIFWKFESHNLEKRFDEKLKDKIANKSENQHYSVFALAPIPLLIKLGSLLTDKTSVQTYQKIREPDSWNWQEDAPELEFLLIPSKVKFNQVVLILSISALIADEDVYSVLENEISVWKIVIENPNNDCIRNKSHLSAFRTIFRKVLNDIKAVHGTDVTINLFSAVPVSVAVEIGRVWMPKADLPFVIYDRNRGKGLPFIKSISIGDNNE